MQANIFTIKIKRKKKIGQQQNQRPTKHLLWRPSPNRVGAALARYGKPTPSRSVVELETVSSTNSAHSWELLLVGLPKFTSYLRIFKLMIWKREQKKYWISPPPELCQFPPHFVGIVPLFSPKSDFFKYYSRMSLGVWIGCYYVQFLDIPVSWNSSDRLFFCASFLPSSNERREGRRMMRIAVFSLRFFQVLYHIF